jgi:hypothetical protein
MGGFSPLFRHPVGKDKDETFYILTGGDKDVTQCTLVDTYRRFGGTCCFHLQIINL